jgi:CheY-like chemotaxis protein
MGKRIILLVEDNPVDEELARMALKQLRDESAIVVVHDGVEALEYINNAGKPDTVAENKLPKVVFLDLKLPKLNGFDVLKKIRTNPGTQFLPVVILTSSDEESDILTSYRLGANSYIRKPVEYQHYAESIQQIGSYWLLLNQSPPEW